MPRFFDFVNIISILASPYPGAHNFFSTDCPKPVGSSAYLGGWLQTFLMFTPIHYIVFVLYFVI